LMGKGQMEDALKLFTLNTEQYPHSWNVWDSLAECYLKSGDSDSARKYYEKSLHLNPDNQNARKVLSSMEENK
jgi:Tfp pilus assembly protein PilF